MIFKGIKNRLNAMLQIGIEEEIRRIHADMRKRMDDPLICYGRKVYSQCDEDGIIEEIFRRIGTGSRICIEIGCGNGLENNTHYLLLQGWRGIWVDGSAKNIRAIRQGAGIEGDHPHLVLTEAFVTPDNVNDIIRDGLKRLNATDEAVDFLSLDIDGYDLAVLEALDELRPRVICAEYNAKFPPPLKLAVPFREGHGWSGHDYMGASLNAIAECLEQKGYDLVCCNASAANAFFVLRSENKGRIAVPDIADVYQPARYHLTHRNSGHPPSLGYLRDFLAKTAQKRP